MHIFTFSILSNPAPTNLANQNNWHYCLLQIYMPRPDL